MYGHITVISQLIVQVWEVGNSQFWESLLRNNNQQSNFPQEKSQKIWNRALKNILKPPPSIMFLQCKSAISSKRLQRVDRVRSLLAFYRLLSKKSLSLTFTSSIRILPDLSCFFFETSKLALAIKSAAILQELLWLCEKREKVSETCLSIFFLHVWWSMVEINPL